MEVADDRKLKHLSTSDHAIIPNYELGALSSHFSSLADAVEGSSIRTFRNKQMEKAHVPLDFWKTG